MSFIFSFAVTCCLSAHLMLFLCFLAIFWLWRFWRLARNCFALFVLVYSARCSVDCFCCCYCCCAESATSVCSPLDMLTLYCAGRAAGVFLLYCCYWSFATFDMAQFAFLSLSSISLSLPRFAWVSIALFNYWFIAILLAEVIQCQLRRLLQGPVPFEMWCSTAFCTAIQLLFNCCFDVSPDELAYTCTVPCRMPRSSILCSSPTRFAQSWVALSCLRLLINNLISSLNFENSLALTKSIACFCGSSCKSVCWVLDNASVTISKCSKAHNVLKAQLST